ncbi:tRNA pseudouridine(55) synthase TruB [Candidatus Saccharibacteria bacterium]|nr:tRNA pseudouridine(55) synthase TruB [Candidatus Saccharibacteria bacterium]
MDENQIILIDKPADISSFGVVAKVRGFLKAQFNHKIKVGHTGTLDPFATGLLIILTGKNTKKSSEFLKLDKIYDATLKLGYTSTTGDPEGQIVPYKESEELQRHFSEGGFRSAAARGLARSPRGRPPLGTRTTRRVDGRERRDPERNVVEAAIKSFVGKITQTPPRFSAIKVNGERAYKLARKGKNFEIPSRKVEIYSIDILDYHYPELQIRVHCSSGTYIRTLAEDIGKKLGTGAYLTSLRRLKIGNYDVRNALPLSHFAK